MFGKKKPESQHLIIEIAPPIPGKPPKDEVRANRFVLTDTKGKARAQLQCAGGGAVALTFHDDQEKVGLLLGLDPNQSPTLAFVKDGKMKVNLDLDRKTHQPNLSVKGEGGSRVEVGFDESENAAIHLHDVGGSLRLSISLTAKGDAQIKLYDNKGYVTNEFQGRT
jgi:hypothetical protein